MRLTPRRAAIVRHVGAGTAVCRLFAPTEPRHRGSRAVGRFAVRDGDPTMIRVAAVSGSRREDSSTRKALEIVLSAARGAPGKLDGDRLTDADVRGRLDDLAAVVAETRRLHLDA